VYAREEPALHRDRHVGCEHDVARENRSSRRLHVEDGALLYAERSHALEDARAVTLDRPREPDQVLPRVKLTLRLESESSAHRERHVGVVRHARVQTRAPGGARLD
jgi:hypothetical protein